MCIVDSISPERSLWSKHVVHIVFAGELDGSLVDVVSHDEAVRGHRLFDPDELDGLALHPPLRASCGAGSPATRASTSGRCGRHEPRARVGRVLQRPRPRRPAARWRRRHAVRSRRARRTTSAGSPQTGGGRSGLRRATDRRSPLRARAGGEAAPRRGRGGRGLALRGARPGGARAATRSSPRDRRHRRDRAILHGHPRPRGARRRRDRGGGTPPDGAVVVHCFAGKDRTGIVSALLLRLAGVPDEAVADDYALSGPGRLAVDDWIATAEDDTSVRSGRVSAPRPPRASYGCSALRDRRGGAEQYLRGRG